MKFSRDQLFALVVGIALGVYVVPRVRAFVVDRMG